MSKRRPEGEKRLYRTETYFQRGDCASISRRAITMHTVTTAEVRFKEHPLSPVALRKRSRSNHGLRTAVNERRTTPPRNHIENGSSGGRTLFHRDARERDLADTGSTRRARQGTVARALASLLCPCGHAPRHARTPSAHPTWTSPPRVRGRLAKGAHAVAAAAVTPMTPRHLSRPAPSEEPTRTSGSTSAPLMTAPY